MFGLRRLSRSSQLSAEALWDVHCHLLPAVDDGVEDNAESLRCIEGLAAMGYCGAVLTPHIYPEVFDNDEGELRRRFEAFRAWLGERRPAFGVQLGAEYFCDDTLGRRIRGGGVLTFGQRQPCILIELPVMVMPGSLESALQACRKEGLTPVIAHVERYTYTRGRQGLALLRGWREGGAALQVNLGALVGQQGFEVRRHSRRLLKQRVVDLLGTDLHQPRSLERIEKAWQWLAGRSFASATLARHQAVTQAAKGDERQASA